MNIDNGNLIFLPAYTDDTENEKFEKEFFKSILSLISDLKKSTGDFELPNWSLDYYLPDELKQKDNLQKLEKKLEDIINKKSKQKKIIAKIEEYKILFTGTGKALEVQIGKIFEELGFIVTEGLPGRDDLILRFEDKVAVVEVKGVSKSGAEKHAAQLEKWVSEYYSTHEVMPKGILIVNAYKDLPLKDRTEDAFPSQMLSYSEKRSHCLLTGVQLLGIYLYCINNHNRTKDVIEKILSTNGIFADFTDWTSFLYNQSEENIESDKKALSNSMALALIE